MQSSAEITAQITQVRSEMTDITRSLDRITDIQSMLGAKAELRDRAEVLDLLMSRLEDAKKREAEQAEQDKKRALQQERDDAKAEHDQLSAEFESIMQPLEQAVLDALDRLDPLALARFTLQIKHANALFTLRNHEMVWDSERLSLGTGWYSNTTEGASSPVRQCLYELYAARHGMPGRLGLEGQEPQAVTAHRAWMMGGAGSQQPQQLTDPVTPEADAMSFLDRRANGGDD